jgi:predicted membrane protein
VPNANFPTQASASRTKSKRFRPKIVGAPNALRATADSVLAISAASTAAALTIAANAAPGKPTLIRVAARGNRFYLFVDEALVATVDRTKLRNGRVGVIAMSKSRFCYDDFTVRSAGK